MTLHSMDVGTAAAHSENHADVMLLTKKQKRKYIFFIRKPFFDKR